MGIHANFPLNNAFASCSRRQVFWEYLEKEQMMETGSKKLTF